MSFLGLKTDENPSAGLVYVSLNRRQMTNIFFMLRHIFVEIIFQYFKIDFTFLRRFAPVKENKLKFIMM